MTESLAITLITISGIFAMMFMCYVFVKVMINTAKNANKNDDKKN